MADGPDGGSPSALRPTNLVVVLLDSLNRHLLEAYGSDEFATPRLRTFADSASLPCVPARHDILVGALDFPWRPWGSIEIWEDAITRSLRARGVTTMLVSDHPHLFEVGGENDGPMVTALADELRSIGAPADLLERIEVS